MKCVKFDDIPTWSEVTELLEKMRAAAQHEGVRDYLLVALLANTGVRTSELLNVRFNDVKFDDNVLLIRQLKKKGEFVREVLVPPALMQLLKDYCGALGISGTERIFPLSRRTLLQIVHKNTKRHLGRRIRSHAFRHAYATRILEKSKNVDLCRRLLGHSNISITTTYLNYTVRDYAKEIIDALGGDKNV